MLLNIFSYIFAYFSKKKFVKVLRKSNNRSKFAPAKQQKTHTTMIYKSTNKTNVATKYYIDYIIEKTLDGTITGAYYQLVRTEDEAILFAHKQLTYIKSFCFDSRISCEMITIL